MARSSYYHWVATAAARAERAAADAVLAEQIRTVHAGSDGTYGAPRITAELRRGAAPIPASSGKTERHRLNRGDNRAANHSLHMIGVVRLRYCARTRDYSARRTAEGKSKQEIIRCLKRYIAGEVYYTLRADLKDLASAT